MNPMNYKDEMYLAMLERTIRRLWVLSLVSIFLLVGSNIAWIYYESQFEDSITETTTSVDAQSDSGNATGIIGDGNEVINDGKGKDN